MMINLIAAGICLSAMLYGIAVEVKCGPTKMVWLIPVLGAFIGLNIALYVSGR